MSSKAASVSGSSKSSGCAGILGMFAAILVVITLAYGCLSSGNTTSSSGARGGSNSLNTTTTSSVGAWEKILSAAVGKPKGEYSEYQWAKEPGFGVIDFQFVADENLTDNLTSRGAKLEVKNLLEEVASSGKEFAAVRVVVCYPYVNKFGEVSINKIAELTYTSDIVDRIQFKTIDTDMIYTVADPSNVKAEWR
jgi:hypothetical protein